MTASLYVQILTMCYNGNMKKIIFVIIMLITFTQVFAQGIVGTWLREDDGAWFMFKADGTVERSPLWHSTYGRYEISRIYDGYLEFYWEGDDSVQGWGFSISNNGDTLTLSIGGGESDFRRVKPAENIVLQNNDTMGYVASPDNNVYQRILPNYNTQIIGSNVIDGG